MYKKIVSIGVLLVMAFSLTACQGVELAEYKLTAKTGLETYAHEKGEENYSVENWAAIGGLVADGKVAVDAATDKNGVDVAVAAAKQAVDAVQTLQQTEAQEFAAYKAAAKAELDGYAAAQGEGNYSVANWAVIGGFVTQGKAAIDAAANKADVDSAVEAAKEKIDEVLHMLPMSEWNKIIDDTLNEFKKPNANAYVYYGCGYDITDPNGSNAQADALIYSLYFDNDIARFSMNRMLYYLFEGGIFYKYTRFHSAEASDYVITELGSIQSGKTLYEHIFEYIQSEPEDDFNYNDSFFFECFDMLLDSKGRFNISIVDDNTYRFETFRDDGFSLWDIFEFTWDMREFHYSLSKVICEVRVKDGKLSGISFCSDNPIIDLHMGLSFFTAMLR